MTTIKNRNIAAAFMPNRHHYWYARIKLSTDPLYAGVADALKGDSEPLLDLGCGIGLLAHALHARGHVSEFLGVDIDRRKIESARAAALKANLRGTRFETLDLSSAFPPHHGSVTMLDVLQFVRPDAQAGLIDAAIDALTPRARLVIRTGLHRDHWRMSVTRAADRVSRWTRWMNTAPQRYPNREELEAHFARRGLQATFRPLHGRLPLENWLIVATHVQAPGG